jgi:3-methylcrotonyl-CoA carboxylase alpha subunit
MRAVDKAEDFADALASCKREAINSFGDDAVLIEKYVQRPRHIEIQVFGDTHGNYVYLFERDCSVQRRHQKVLEEAPAPGMTAKLRARMGQAAVEAARAVNYVGAGTVEFIVEQPQGFGLEGADEDFAAGPPQGEIAPLGGSAAHAVASVGARFFFMEMNTRLQVEHPVTEAITGLDLVEWQLRVASGEPLPLQQSELQIHGHAIEARICAESPDNNFLPATGTLHVYGLPESSSFERAENGVRVDSGVREGDTISPFYDSMVAKLIVHGATREEALARMDTALTQTHIVGLSTNVQFLRHVVRSASFASAQLDTALIPREAAVLFNREDIGLPLAAAATVAHTILQEQLLAARTDVHGWTDPWAQREGWLSHGVSRRSFALDFKGEAHTAVLTRLRSGGLQLALGGQLHSLQFAAHGGQGGPGAIDITFDGKRVALQVYRAGDVLHVFAAQGATQITVVDALAHAGDTQAEGGRLTAPMPGKVVSFAVKAGDAVKKGQALAVMEAMKMEHTIAAPSDGTVGELLFAPGDQVTEGAELLRLEAA